MKLPNFLVVGFPKCGSTALHYYLEAHPEIFMPTQKELHYFTADKLLKLNRGPGDQEVKKFMLTTKDSYLKAYKNAGNEKMIGDASPSYINHPDRIPKIKSLLGEPKIIILLRDPIKRAYSNYLHLKREQRETLSFFEALQAEEKRKKLKYSDFWYYQYNSTYYYKVDAYAKAFDHVLILTQEELNKNTKNTLFKVYDFLGVEQIEPENVDQRYNAGGVYEKNILTQTLLKQSKLRSGIKKLIPITPKMKKIKEKIIAKYQQPAPAISKEAENYLIEKCKDDVKQLVNDYAIEITHWNKAFQKHTNN